MNFWKQLLLPLAFWLTGSVVDCLGLPPVSAQPLEPDVPAPSQQAGPDISHGLSIRPMSGGSTLPAPTVSTHVTTTISGLIVRTTVSQTFHNPSSEWAEGIYVFPLPEQAAVDHLRMRIGERVIEGMIQERAEARKTFEQAKRKGQRASLLEQERPNVFTASVANLAPGEPIMVEIEYQDTVRYDQGRFSLRFPMVVGPRYIPGTPLSLVEAQPQTTGAGWAVNTDQVPDASRITPPVQHPVEGPINPLTLQIDLAPGFLLDRVESPTHPIRVETHSNGRLHITLADPSTFADRDFELAWTPQASHEAQTQLFLEEHEGETYGLVFFLPPQINEAGPGDIPREVIFVMDTSGSMAGASLVQAKAALKLAVSRLTPRDRFNIIQFNSITKQLFPLAVPADTRAIQRALSYVNSLQAEGGTEMLPAMVQALSHQKEEQTSLRQVIFITDGLIGNEEEFFATLQRLLGQTRLFTVGIGSAPNGHFMRKAAQHGRGTFTYIGTTQEVQEKMHRLFVKLEQPAFLNLALEGSAGAAWDLLPAPLPDVYAGEPLMVSFRTATPPSQLIVSGTHGTVPWKRELPFAAGLSRSGIAVHWARQKISQLTDHQASSAQPDQSKQQTELRQGVIDVALRHHLVSRYTSLVAVETTPARPEHRPLHSHAMKANLPHGMQYEAIFGWPQTATPSTLYLLLGIFMLWMGGLWTRQQVARM
ncbi:marine proteobacterial sortase target protein [Candidatus Nitrospira allomarina]|uniref:Marine proteobacterial sortase target protein n=1 Tax=Candidatus Nitrospira allomarina TaxID=3020900 RepID=A0AA96GF57_9BACT|nr:marine proteobacterial sortase target protein [Candidatus Nitrospira allomarina]WNM57738.1 marine proteobacterial sortase target protein [Candidatus Nitrospira allomarina]